MGAWPWATSPSATSGCTLLQSGNIAACNLGPSTLVFVCFGGGELHRLATSCCKCVGQIWCNNVAGDWVIGLGKSPKDGQNHWWECWLRAVPMNVWNTHVFFQQGGVEPSPCPAFSQELAPEVCLTSDRGPQGAPADKFGGHKWCGNLGANRPMMGQNLKPLAGKAPTWHNGAGAL